MYIYIYCMYRYTFLTVRIARGQRWLHAARSWASHDSDDGMAPRAEQRSVTDGRQPAVFPSTPHKERASASDDALSLPCRTQTTTDASPSLVTIKIQSLSIKSFFFYYKSPGLFIYTRSNTSIIDEECKSFSHSCFTPLPIVRWRCRKVRVSAL